MTSFPPTLNDANRTTLRASGYWVRALACLCPEEIVFRAQSSQAISAAPFIQFTYDSVSVGAYTDVWQGMVCYLSATTSVQDAFYRGRVRLAPTSGIFYIDKNPSVIADGTYIIVTRDADLDVRVRDDELIDMSVAYHDLPPMLKDLPNTVILYDSDNNGTVTWTPSQTGIAVDAAATTVDTWSWAVSGSGSSSINNAALEHPTFTFAAGYHYLVRVIYTDDNDVSNYQIVHVYAVTRTFSAPVARPVVTTSLRGDVDDGWTASLTAYADVDELIDRTHCAVFALEHFGDDSTAPMVNTVWMAGRIRSDSIRTEGSTEAGVLSEVTFEVEGLTAYLRRLRIPNDIVRATAAPNEWGEITDPTPYRMAVYMVWAYTTLTNITSFGVEDGNFEAWVIGGEPRGIDGGFVVDVLENILDPIKAEVNYAPDGTLFLAQNTNYKSDRSGVPLVTTFGLTDMREYNVDLDSSRTVAQVIAFGGSYNSTSNTFDLYSASAPSIPYGDGGEMRELTREVLSADATITEAEEELGLRASNDYAFNNSKDLLSMTLFDSYAGVLIPTTCQRYAAVIPASSNTRGKAYTATDYWWLQSVTKTINADGSVDVSGEWVEETSFDDAQVVSSLLPINLSDLNPVLPVLPNDFAFPTDPLELYPTDDPALEELQPMDPFSGLQAYAPLPPDVAAQAAANAGSPLCKTLRVNFRWETNVTSSWTTTLGADYLMTASGQGRIGYDSPEPTFRFLQPAGFPGGSLSSMTHNSDGSWTVVFASALGGDGTHRIAVCMDDESCWLYDSITSSAGITFPANYDCGTTASGTNYLVGLNLGAATAGNCYGGISYARGSAFTTTIVMRLCDPEEGEALYADAFYSFRKNTDGTMILDSAELLDGGLYLDNNQYPDIPPPNTSSVYPNLPFTGTGNQLNARMEFDTYTNNQNVYLYLEMCRKT